MWRRDFDLFSFGIFRGKTIEMRRRRENNRNEEEEEEEEEGK